MNFKRRDATPLALHIILQAPTEVITHFALVKID